MSEDKLLKAAGCEVCHRWMRKFQRSGWTPTPPYWNPATDHYLCKPCFWTEVHGTESPKKWLAVWA